MDIDLAQFDAEKLEGLLNEMGDWPIDLEPSGERVGISSE